MTPAAGWYPDPGDSATIRYWDGAKWTHVSVDGVPVASDTQPQAPDPAAVIPTAPTAAAAKTTAPVAGLNLSKLPGIAMLLFVGSAIAALGMLLPWESDTTPFGGTVTQGPIDTGGGLVLLLALLAALLWVAWPIRLGQLSKRRLVGVALFAAALSFFVFAKLAALGDAQEQASVGTDFLGQSLEVDYGAGIGLFIYSIGLIGIWIAVVRNWLAGRSHAEPAT